MKVSSNMLKRYLNRNLTQDELYKLTNEYITEVESVSTLLQVENLVVGYVNSCIRHPNADKLSVCQVDLGTGSLIELDRLAEEPVEILVNGKKVAYGEVVVVDENFGVRITSIVSNEEKVKSLGRQK